MSIKARKKHPVIKVKGTAKYAHLNEPNKRFEKEFGSYSCDLVIDKDQAEMIKNTLTSVVRGRVETSTGGEPR